MADHKITGLTPDAFNMVLVLQAEINPLGGEPAGTGARPEEFVAGDLDLPTLEELEMAAALRSSR